MDTRFTGVPAIGKVVEELAALCPTNLLATANLFESMRQMVHVAWALGPRDDANGSIVGVPHSFAYADEKARLKFRRFRLWILMARFKVDCASSAEIEVSRRLNWTHSVRRRT